MIVVTAKNFSCTPEMTYLSVLSAGESSTESTARYPEVFSLRVENLYSFGRGGSYTSTSSSVTKTDVHVKIGCSGSSRFAPELADSSNATIGFILSVAGEKRWSRVGALIERWPHHTNCSNRHALVRYLRTVKPFLIQYRHSLRSTQIAPAVARGQLQAGLNSYTVARVGIEPSTRGFSLRCITIRLTPFGSVKSLDRIHLGGFCRRRGAARFWARRTDWCFSGPRGEGCQSLRPKPARSFEGSVRGCYAPTDGESRIDDSPMHG